MNPSIANFLEFSKPFVDASKNVFQTMIKTGLNPKKPLIKTDNSLQGDITAIIGLSGEVEKEGVKKPYKAMLVMSFPYQTYFKISSALLNKTYEAYVPEIRDVGAEIVNMVMGNAKRDLRLVGYTSNMAIPSIIEGKNHQLTYPDKTSIVLIPIDCDHGEFFIELCYTDEE